MRALFGGRPESRGARRRRSSGSDKALGGVVNSLKCPVEGQWEKFMRNVARYILPAALCGCLCLLAACLGEKQQQQKQAPPPLVTLFTVEAKDHPYPAEYQAQTQGSKAVEVRSRVEAIIEKRMYVEGDYVKAGQLLFQLERDQYEAQVQEAAAKYENAKREWNRIRPLYEKNAVSQKDRDTALANYDSARAALRQAKINLDYCQVTSPVSGFTGKEQVTPGNLVRNDSLLTYVNQTDPLYVNFAIAGPDLMRRQQLAAEKRLEYPPDKRYKAHIRLLDGTMYDREGAVTFIDTRVEPATGVVKARAEFPNSDDRVMPGQYVRIYMEGDTLKNAVLIPQKCVLMTQQGTLVMVVDKDNKVSPRPVKLNVSIGENYLVDSGLQGGERIVLEGLVKARPGQPVRVEAPKAPQGQAAAPAADK